MITASIFDTTASLYSAAVRLTVTAICNTGVEPAALVVPGGRTPRPLFDALAATPATSGEGLHFAYTDERHVPEMDPQSNYALSRDMITALQVPPARVLRVRTELPLDEAARCYHNAWQEFFESGGVIPLAILGLGDDGHTCSLFTAEQVGACNPDCFAEAVRRDSGPHRVTVTPALLARVEHIVFLATGQEKAAVVDAMLQESSPVPAALAVRHAPRVSLWYAPED